MVLKNLFRFKLIIISIFWITNCGGETSDSLVSISPNEPFILTVDRRIIFGLETFIIPKPNITFQLRIDNKGNGAPITIVGLTLDVTGPKGRKTIPIDPAGNIFRFSGSQFIFSPRAFFAEVPAYQASFCMDKVTYLREPNYSRTCEVIGADNTKIPEFGVSAFNTTESENGSACCPNGAANLTEVVIVAGGLQDYQEDEVIPLSESYSINALVVGFFGTFLEPVANYNTQVFFNARSN